MHCTSKSSFSSAAAASTSDSANSTIESSNRNAEKRSLALVLRSALVLPFRSKLRFSGLGILFVLGPDSIQQHFFFASIEGICVACALIFDGCQYSPRKPSFLYREHFLAKIFLSLLRVAVVS